MAAFEWMCGQLSKWTFDEFRAVCREIAGQAKDPAKTATAIEVLTLLNDRRYSTGAKRRSHLLQVVHTELNRLFGSLPASAQKIPKARTGSLISRRVAICAHRWRTKRRWSLTPRILRRKRH